LIWSSASKADSASAARSENNVKCFAFCLGISNAKSASNANSESRTNSPGNTASASPINQDDNTPIQLPPIQQQKHHQQPLTVPLGCDYCKIVPPASTSAAATACIDNTGSVQDEGYAFGYYDAQHGKSILSAKDHGNHTDEWRQGYRDGWQAGANDLADGVNKQPC
jgi:hypothetical protein